MKQPHFLNSTAWQKFQKDLGNQTFKQGTKNYQLMAILARDGAKKIYCPYSPFIANTKGIKQADQYLTKLAKEHKAIMIRIEPNGKIDAKQLRQLGYRKVKSVQPELTWLIDLSGDEKQILANMNTSSRRYYRKGFRQNLQFSQSEDPADFDKFLQLLRQVADNNKANLHHDDYLKQQFEVLSEDGTAKLFVVKLDGEVIAASVAYDDGKTRHYAHAAADYQHRKLNAGVFLAANMILDAHKNGFTTFDFWGITDSDDPNHPWYGFTKFKKSFGGQEHRYLGTWEKPINKWAYFGLSIAKRIKKILF